MAEETHLPPASEDEAERAAALARAITLTREAAEQAAIAGRSAEAGKLLRLVDGLAKGKPRRKLAKAAPGKRERAKLAKAGAVNVGSA